MGINVQERRRILIDRASSTATLASYAGAKSDGSESGLEPAFGSSSDGNVGNAFPVLSGVPTLETFVEMECISGGGLSVPRTDGGAQFAWRFEGEDADMWRGNSWTNTHRFGFAAECLWVKLTAVFDECHRPHGIQLPSGRIVIAAEMESYAGGEFDIDVYHKDPGDVGWTRVENVVSNDDGFKSPQLVRREDGLLLLYYVVKNSAGNYQLAASFSADDGDTWSTLASNVADVDDLPSDASSLEVEQVNGYLVACIGKEDGSEVHWLYSIDGGVSFRRVAKLEGGEWLRPSIIPLVDDTLLFVWYEVTAAQKIFVQRVAAGLDRPDGDSDNAIQVFQTAGPFASTPNMNDIVVWRDPDGAPYIAFHDLDTVPPHWRALRGALDGSTWEVASEGQAGIFQFYRHTGVGSQRAGGLCVVPCDGSFGVIIVNDSTTDGNIFGDGLTGGDGAGGISWYMGPGNSNISVDWNWDFCGTVAQGSPDGSAGEGMTYSGSGSQDQWAVTSSVPTDTDPVAMDFNNDGSGTSFYASTGPTDAESQNDDMTAVYTNVVYIPNGQGSLALDQICASVRGSDGVGSREVKVRFSSNGFKLVDKDGGEIYTFTSASVFADRWVEFILGVTKGEDDGELDYCFAYRFLDDALGSGRGDRSWTKVQGSYAAVSMTLIGDWMIAEGHTDNQVVVGVEGVPTTAMVDISGNGAPDLKYTLNPFGTVWRYFTSSPPLPTAPFDRGFLRGYELSTGNFAQLASTITEHTCGGIIFRVPTEVDSSDQLPLFGSGVNGPYPAEAFLWESTAIELSDDFASASGAKLTHATGLTGWLHLQWRTDGTNVSWYLSEVGGAFGALGSQTVDFSSAPGDMRGTTFLIGYGAAYVGVHEVVDWARIYLGSDEDLSEAALATSHTALSSVEESTTGLIRFGCFTNPAAGTVEGVRWLVGSYCLSEGISDWSNQSGRGLFGSGLPAQSSGSMIGALPQFLVDGVYVSFSGDVAAEEDSYGAETRYQYSALCTNPGARGEWRTETDGGVHHVTFDLGDDSCLPPWDVLALWGTNVARVTVLFADNEDFTSSDEYDLDSLVIVPQVATGAKVPAGSTTTKTVYYEGASWTPGQWVGYYFRWEDGPNEGVAGKIVHNDTSTLVVDCESGWTDADASGSTFSIFSDRMFLALDEPVDPKRYMRIRFAAQGTKEGYYRMLGRMVALSTRLMTNWEWQQETRKSKALETLEAPGGNRFVYVLGSSRQEVDIEFTGMQRQGQNQVKGIWNAAGAGAQVVGVVIDTEGGPDSFFPARIVGDLTTRTQVLFVQTAESDAPIQTVVDVDTLTLSEEIKGVDE